MANVSPSIFLKSSFHLLFKTIRFRVENTDDNIHTSFKKKSLSELILQIEGPIRPIATSLAQLFISLISILIVINTLSLIAIDHLAFKSDLNWAFRNVYFVSMISLGFGSIILISDNVSAGLYCLLYSNIIAAILHVLIATTPAAHLFSLHLFSHTLNHQGLSYVLGAFTVGLCLALYANWYSYQAVPATQGVRARLNHRSIYQLIFVCLLLMGSFILVYYLSQEFDGQRYPKLFTFFVLIPAFIAIGFKYKILDRKKDSPEMKVIGLNISLVLTFSSSAYIIYSFLIEHYFTEKGRVVNAGDWIEGLGLGLLIGIITGIFLTIIQLLSNLILQRFSQRAYIQKVVIFISILITWIGSLRTGAFNHLNPNNKSYTVTWLLLGLFSVSIVYSIRKFMTYLKSRLR